MAKLYDANGAEVEAFLPDEVATQISTAVAAKETEFTTVKTELEGKLADTETRLKERSGEFAQFRKLNDEQVAKLSVAERTIYENGLALQQEREKNITLEKQRHDSTVEAAIRAKVGTDEKLYTKVKDMWAVFGIEANTQEQIDQKTLMIIGAIGTTEPDLIASVNGFQGGSYTPPVQQKEGEKSFADTDVGKAGAAELGITLEAPKKD